MIVCLLFFFSGKSFAQYAVGDYGSISSGNWSNSIWGTWNGATWTPVGTTPVSTNNVWILAGTNVITPVGSIYSCKNLIVETTAKLWSNNGGGSNVYIYVYGTAIVCNGQIGNGAIFDNISFGLEGPTCTINGIGQFDASRMRKNTSVNTTTNIFIAMNINLRWNSVSGTQLYNASPGTNLNVTINAFCTVTLVPNGPNIGNVAIDGIDGLLAGDAGGVFTINGTLIISGKLYLTTNNVSPAYTCTWIINGLVQANEIVASASGLALHSLTVNSGGKLDITGTPAWSSLAGNIGSNNSFIYNNGSTVEYSAAGTQTVRVRSEFGGAALNGYYNLILSNTGNKSTTLTDLWVRNDITITGSAILDPNPANSLIFIGGNWSNYNQTGFAEKSTTVYFNGALLETISCPGGEVYNILRYQKTGSFLQFNNPVDVITQLIFASNGYVDLNSNALTVRNFATTGITGVTNSRYIVSEKTDNSSKIVWRINTGIGTYTYPFGVPPGGAANYVPVVVTKTTASNIGDLTFSTYNTPPTNLPWPTTPTAVSNLWAYFNIYNNPDNRHYTVDRFWEVSSTAPTTIDSVAFSYRTSELPDMDPDPLHLKAQFWAGAFSVWNLNQYGVPAITNKVTVGSFTYYNTAWTLTSLTSPLPIELLTFEARPEEKQVDIVWATATEINNQYFTVEKSIDGFEFFEIGTIDGAGNSSEVRNYNLTDPNPTYGISYYRLRQTDYDGTYTFSEVVPVKYNKRASQYSIFPNPANDNIYIAGDIVGESQLIIRTTDGKEIQQLSLDGTKEINQLNLSGLSSGLYIIEIKSATETQFLRLVKR